MVPIVGDFFNSIVSNQILESQIKGTASFYYVDINGIPKIVRDIPAKIWEDFYMQAKTIAFDNYVLNQEKINEVNQAQTVDSLAGIQIDIFPPLTIFRVDL
jgi:hypothetical protein